MSGNTSAQWDRFGRIGLAIVVFAAFAVRPVSAQTTEVTEEAGSAVCSTGLGTVIEWGLALVMVFLVIAGLFQIVFGWNNKHSRRSDKQQEGAEQIKYGVYTVGGVFIPALFGTMASETGIPVLECVDLTNLLVILPTVPA